MASGRREHSELPLLDDDESDDADPTGNAIPDAETRSEGSGADGWEEPVDEEHSLPATCPFCPATFNIGIIWTHCKEAHEFDLAELKRTHAMDEYSYRQMVNYVRKVRASPRDIMKSDPNSQPWKQEEYFRPVVQDDPLLTYDFKVDDDSPDDDPETIGEGDSGDLAQLVRMMRDVMGRIISDPASLPGVGHSNGDSNGHISMEGTGDTDEYFGSYSHFGIHHEMLSDTVRTLAYRDAMLLNPSAIQDAVVLDVGCGTGILSLIAAKGGASKVYAVEPSSVAAEATEIVWENKLQDTITVVKGKVEEARLPVNEVDIIVSEWMGYFLIFEGMLPSILWARDRYLKPGGIMMPSSCSLYLVGASDPDRYSRCVDFWRDVYGFRMSCMRRSTLKEASVEQVPESAIATQCCQIMGLDLGTCTVQEATKFRSDFRLEVDRDCELTSLVGYFTVGFDLEEPVVMTTAPGQPPTHWKQTVFYLQQPIPVKQGDVVKGKISCGPKRLDKRSLEVKLSIDDGPEVVYFVH